MGKKVSLGVDLGMGSMCTISWGYHPQMVLSIIFKCSIIRCPYKVGCVHWLETIQKVLAGICIVVGIAIRMPTHVDLDGVHQGYANDISSITHWKEHAHCVISYCV